MSTLVHVVDDFTDRKNVNLVTHSYCLMTGTHIVISFRNSWGGKPLIIRSNFVLHGLENVETDSVKASIIRTILRPLSDSHVMAYSPTALKSIKALTPELSVCLIRGRFDLMKCLNHVKQAMEWKSFLRKKQFFWKRRFQLLRDRLSHA